MGGLLTEQAQLHVILPLLLLIITIFVTPCLIMLHKKADTFKLQVWFIQIFLIAFMLQLNKKKVINAQNQAAYIDIIDSFNNCRLRVLKVSTDL